MEDEPYFENNPFVLNKYASDILKITDKLIATATEWQNRMLGNNNLYN